jgi:hypothetical protein
MKTNSQTSIRGVYEMVLRPGLQGRPAAQWGFANREGQARARPSLTST